MLQTNFQCRSKKMTKTTFYELFSQSNWAQTQHSIYQKTSKEVKDTLSKTYRNLEDFKTLISPAAEPYLKTLSQRSHQQTLLRFGKTIQMFVPLYLSNECKNICTYCGFSMNNKVPRKTLSDSEILQEVQAIKNMGYEHILIVTGEDNQTVGIPYLSHAIDLIKPHFAQVSLEVQPLESHEYQLLVSKGLHTVLVYQETYRKKTYKHYHPKGKKSLFEYRLNTPDRLGKAGIYKMGLGCLLGLEDWRTDSFFVAMHLNYLEKKYWQSKFSVSFPRLRPHLGNFKSKQTITDKHLIQLICAYRLCFPDLELSLSTREPASLRNELIKLGITSISAGSQTQPGGYVNPSSELEQFSIDDQRSPQEMSQYIESQGYETVWKDWDTILM